MYRDLIGEMDRKRPLGRPRHRNIWVDTIKLIHKETGLRYEPVSCGSEWEVMVCSLNFALRTRVPQKAEKFLTNREIIPSLKRTSLYGSTSPILCRCLKRARFCFASCRSFSISRYNLIYSYIFCMKVTDIIWFAVSFRFLTSR